MGRSTKGAGVLHAIMLLATCAASARTIMPPDEEYADSFEYLVCKARAVLRVRVQERVDGRGVEVLDVLKGSVSRRHFVCKKYDDPFPPTPLADGREFLVVATGRDEDEDPSAWSLAAAAPLDGRTSGNVKPLRSMDGAVVAGAGALTMARAAVAAGTPAGWDRPAYVRMRATEPGKAAAVLRIPCDDRAKALALRWTASADSRQRREAARLLRHFDAPDSVAALRRLLADEASEVADPENGDRRIYPVRLAAFMSLRLLKAADVREPRIDVVPWPLRFAAEHPLGLTTVGVLLVGPPLAWAWGRWRRKNRGRFVEPFSLGRTAFAAAALGSAVLGVVSAHYWSVSRGGGALFTHLSEGGIGRMINSTKERVQLAQVEGMSQAYTTAGWEASPMDLEARLGSPDVKVKAAAWGFAYARAENPSSSAERLTFVQAPYWAILSAAAVLPAVWLARQVRFSRRRRRAAAGRCLACGYDLRHTPQRCPECGLDVPPELQRLIPSARPAEEQPTSRSP